MFACGCIVYLIFAWNLTKKKHLRNHRTAVHFLMYDVFNNYVNSVKMLLTVSTGLPPMPPQQWQSGPPPTQTMLQVAPPPATSAVPQLAQVTPPQLSQPPPAPPVAALTSLPPTQVRSCLH